MSERPNCDNCKNISITEARQHSEKSSASHICTKYRKRVFHRSTKPGYHDMIFPCDECEKDNFSHFEGVGS